MNDFITDLAKYLEDQGIATRSTNLFIGDIPEDKQDSIILYYSPSPTPNPSIENYEQYIDIWSRYSNSMSGYDILKEISNLLHRKVHYDLDNYHIYLSSQLGMIDDMDRDLNKRKLYKLTIGFNYRPLQEVS